MKESAGSSLRHHVRTPKARRAGSTRFDALLWGGDGQQRVCCSTPRRGPHKPKFPGREHQGPGAPQNPVPRTEGPWQVHFSSDPPWSRVCEPPPAAPETQVPPHSHLALRVKQRMIPRDLERYYSAETYPSLTGPTQGARGDAPTRGAPDEHAPWFSRSNHPTRSRFQNVRWRDPRREQG